MSAWVKFDGTTGTLNQNDVNVNSSFNISSIGDRGIGRYTLNFDTPMNTVHYAVVGMCGNGAGSNITNTHSVMQDDILTTSSFGIKVNQSNTDIDKAYVSVAVFGELS